VHQGPKTPIYRSPRSSDFEETHQNPRARNLQSLCRFTVSRAQLRSGQASSAPSTIVEGENGTGASPQELVMDPDLRSKPPVVACSQLEPTSHKVSKNKLNLSLRCRRNNPRQKPWTIARVEASPVNSNDGIIGRPVMRRATSRSTLSHPISSQWSRLDCEIPLRDIKYGPLIASSTVQV
jgi:hypothetical protein